MGIHFLHKKIMSFSNMDCFIYFNWRLITLQYCIGFAIHQHVSATGIHVFPIPLGHLSAPVPSILSYIEPGLVISFLYDTIYISMPFSQIIPPSPSPTESKSLFCTSVSLFAVSHTGLSLPSF